MEAFLLVLLLFMPPSNESTCPDNLITDPAAERNTEDAAEAWGIDEDVLSNDGSEISNYSDELDFGKSSSMDYLNLPQPSAPPKSTSFKSYTQSIPTHLHSLATKQRVDTFRRLLELSHKAPEARPQQFQPQSHRSSIDDLPTPCCDNSREASTQPIDDALIQMNNLTIKSDIHKIRDSSPPSTSPIPTINGYPLAPNDLKIDSSSTENFSLEDKVSIPEQYHGSFLDENPQLWSFSTNGTDDNDEAVDELIFKDNDEEKADELLSDYDDNLTKHDPLQSSHYQSDASGTNWEELLPNSSLFSDGKSIHTIKQKIHTLHTTRNINHNDQFSLSSYGAFIDRHSLNNDLPSSEHTNSLKQNLLVRDDFGQDGHLITQNLSPSHEILELNKQPTIQKEYAEIEEPHSLHTIDEVPSRTLGQTDEQLDNDRLIPQHHKQTENIFGADTQFNADFAHIESNLHSISPAPIDVVRPILPSEDTTASHILEKGQEISINESLNTSLNSSQTDGNGTNVDLSCDNISTSQIDKRHPSSPIKEELFLDEALNDEIVPSCCNTLYDDVGPNDDNDYKLEGDDLSCSSESASESQGLIDVSRVHPCISFSWSLSGKAMGVASFPSPQVRVVRDLSANVFFKAILYKAGPPYSFNHLCLKTNLNDERYYFSSQGLLFCEAESDGFENELVCEKILLSSSIVSQEMISDSLSFFMEDQFKRDGLLFHFERRVFCVFLQSLLNQQRQYEEHEGSCDGTSSPIPFLVKNLAEHLQSGISDFINSEGTDGTTELETLNRLLLFDKQEGEKSNQEGPLVDDQIELLRFCLDRPVLLVLFGSSSSAARSSSFISQIGSLIKEQFPNLEVDDWGMDMAVDGNDESKYAKSPRAPFLELVFRVYLIYDQCNLGIQWLKTVTLRDPKYLALRWPYLLLHALQIRPPNGNPSLYLMLAKLFLDVKLSWASQLLLTLGILADESPQNDPIPVVLFQDSLIELNVSLHLQWLRSYVACVFLQAALVPFKITLHEILEKKRRILVSRWSEFTSKYDYSYDAKIAPCPSSITERPPLKHIIDQPPSTSVIGPGVTPFIPALDEKSLVQPQVPTGIPVTQPPRFPITNSFIPPTIVENHQVDRSISLNVPTLVDDENCSIFPELFKGIDFVPIPGSIAPLESTAWNGNMQAFGNESISNMADGPIMNSEVTSTQITTVHSPRDPPKKNENLIPDKKDLTLEATTKGVFQSNSSLLESIKSFFSSSSLSEKGGSRKVRADLGSTNEMIFDKELGRWINPKLPRPEPKKTKPPPLAVPANTLKKPVSAIHDGSPSMEENDTTASSTIQPELFLESQLSNLRQFPPNARHTNSSTITLQTFTEGPSAMPLDQEQHSMGKTITNFDVNNNNNIELQMPQLIATNPTPRKAGIQRKKYVDPFNLTAPTI